MKSDRPASDQTEVKTPVPPPPAPDPAIIWVQVQSIVQQDVVALWPQPSKYSRVRRILPTPHMEVLHSDLAATRERVPFLIKFNEGTPLTTLPGQYDLYGYYEIATKRVYLHKPATNAYEVIPSAIPRDVPQQQAAPAERLARAVST